MQTKFNSSTPMDINSYDINDVVQFAGEDGDANVASPRVRLNLAKMLYEVLGMDLTPDVALATIAEPKATLVLSTAGGGKTTWAQIKAILEKIMRKSMYHKDKKIRGDAILCLVYNKHNVSDMVNKHKDMVARLEARNIKGLDIDDSIHACTLHSFCDGWRREYVAKMDLLGATLLEQAQAESFMRRAIHVACKKMNCEKKANQIDPADALGLYTYYRETMCESIDDLTECDKFIDLSIDIELLEAIFERYDRSKQLQGKYDFVDMLYKFYCLLRDDDIVRNHIQRYYEYVIADEVQDFTPLMWKILQLMVSDGTPLTCIGDEDQNIYSFRGADIYNTLQFDSMFDGGRIYSLEFNRRCGERVLDEARKIIEMNTLRFNKKLRCTKPGGSVVYEPYNSLNGQFVNVLKMVRDMTPQEAEDTVICYREGASSTVLSDMLMKNDIIFNVISGVGPFSHELYRHLFGIFDALEMPYDMQNCTVLYKVLPCNKDEFHQAIGYNPAKGKFTREIQKGVHFKDFDYGPLASRKSFMETINELAAISASIETKPMSDLILPVFQLLNKYFWSFKKNQCNKYPEVDEIMQTRVIKYFQSPLVYSKFFQQYQITKSRYNHYNENREGITVSTFHSLKGLEFKNVIVVCMDDTIYPNYSLIDSKHYSDATKLSLKEAEVRLWYVAVTRAKENLHVFYSKDNPSLYVQYALTDSFPVAGVFPNTHKSFIDDENSEVLDAELETSNTTTKQAEEIVSNQHATPNKLELDLDNGINSPEVTETDIDLDLELDDFEDFPDIAESHTSTQGAQMISEVDAPDLSLDIKLDSTPIISHSANNMWEDTQELVKRSNESASGSDTQSDTIKDETPADDDSSIVLRSGKNLYLDKLLNSL